MRLIKIRILCCFFCVSFSSLAQVFPKNGDTLNYTSILFSFPKIDHTGQYVIELSESDAFDKKMVFTSEVNAKIINSIGFGRKYFWRYRSVNPTDTHSKWSPTYHFVVGNSKYINQELFRYRGQKKNRDKTTKGLFFMDYGRVAVNRSGKFIWYLPEFPFLQENELVRDLKLTPEGTITGLIDSIACEMDLLGNMIWKAPDNGRISGEKSENYHHDLKKLANGNYMVLGTCHDKRKLPERVDSVVVELGTVIEYDKNGNIVWSWNSKDFFTDEFLFSRKRPDGSFDTRTHMNAFSTNGDFVFVGFRDINSIIAIKKKSGEVVESYGGAKISNEKHSAKGFFRRQHDALVLKDGHLAVLNNDSIMDPSVVSGLVLFSRITDQQPESKKVFEYTFDFDTLTNGKSVKMGNLQELENGHLLVNMGALNRCIELSRSGELMWDMFIEKFDVHRKIWEKFPQYRVSHAVSLYPYVFRTKVVTDSIEKESRIIELDVFNIGAKEDTYTIYFEDDNGNLNEQKKPLEIIVSSGKNKKVKLVTKEKGALRISVYSKNCSKSELIDL